MVQLAVIVVLVLLYIIRTNSAHASEHIPVPETFPPHPRLFMNQDEIDKLKTWIGTEPWAKDRMADFVRQNLRDAGSEVKRLKGMPEGFICLEIDNPDGGKSYLVSAEKPQHINIAGIEIDSQLALVYMDEEAQVRGLEVVK